MDIDEDNGYSYPENMAEVEVLKGRVDLNKTNFQLEDKDVDRLNFIQCDEFNEKVRWSNPHRLGLFYDKFLEAFTFRTVFYREATYPFFGIYLNMPGHSYTTIYSIFQMFWSIKFFFGFLSDTKPIFGKARSYYMAIGEYDNYLFPCFFLIALAISMQLHVPFLHPT